MSLAFDPGLHRNSANTPWNAEAETLLAGEWKSGTRVMIIADLVSKFLGHHVSKNAVIGRANRLGLGRHARAKRVFANEMQRLIHKKKMHEAWVSKNRHRLNENQRRYLERRRTRAGAAMVEDFSIPTPQRKTIFELDAHSCRWPIGEPKSDLFFFCGAVSEKDRPYCSAHCRRAYVETRPY